MKAVVNEIESKSAACQIMKGHGEFYEEDCEFRLSVIDEIIEVLTKEKELLTIMRKVVS